jgi:anti-sigma factor RsiW
MPDNVHTRAQDLIDRELVEGIAAADREWLDRHCESCPACAALDRRTAEAIRDLRSVSVPPPPGLAARAQLRVYLRAQELPARERQWTLWISFALCWLLGVASAPLVWRGLEAVGRIARVPMPVLILGFGLWWAAPAAIAAGIWTIEKKRFQER